MMKRVLLVGLVMGLLALCAFGGVAVAEEPVWELYTLTELSLNFKLPNNWLARIGTQAQATFEKYAPQSASSGIVCNANAELPSNPNESTLASGIFFLFSGDNPTPDIPSYTTYTPEAFAALDVGQLPAEETLILPPPAQAPVTTTVLEGQAARFVVTEYTEGGRTYILASTVEHGHFIWIEAMCVAGDPFYDQFMVFLQSCFFFTEALPSSRLLTDAITWQDNYEAFLSALNADTGGYSHTRLEPIRLPEELTWRIDVYEEGTTTVQLNGLSSDTVHLVAAAVGGNLHADTETTENLFSAVAGIPLLITLGGSTLEDVYDPMLFLRAAVNEIKAIDTTRTVRRFCTINGATLTISRNVADPYVAYMLLIDMLPYDSRYENFLYDTD
jgi:hypothetical protein